MERAEEMDFTWESPGKLGIALQQSVDGPRLKSVDCPDKPRLRPGMALIAIQGEFIEGLPFNDVLERMKTAGRPLVLRFALDDEGPAAPERASGFVDEDPDLGTTDNPVAGAGGEDFSAWADSPDDVDGIGPPPPAQPPPTQQYGGGGMVAVEPPKPVAEKSDDRESWGGRIEFLLSCLGYCVGLGNVCWFPYKCASNGGGTFLIPYFICLFVMGIPLMTLEFAIGQHFRKGTYHALSAIDYRFRSLGKVTTYVSFAVAVFYNVVICWSLYFFLLSFNSELPWVGNSTGIYCPNTVLNGDTVLRGEATPQNFWRHCVLQLPSNFNNQTGKWDNIYADYSAGTPVTPLLVSLAVSWGFVMATLAGGIKSSGKVVMVTATLPYFFLVVLLIRGLMLDGAELGIAYYLTPQWDKLYDPTVWTAACTQIFFSLGVGYGGLMSFASYNPSDEDLVTDALILSLGNCLTSFFAGFAIFSILGHMAFTQGVSVDEIVADGIGLAFVVYPDGLATLPGAQIFSACFFAMLFFLGIDGEFATTEVAATLWRDAVPKDQRPKDWVISVVLCVTGFILGLPLVMPTGFYWFGVFSSWPDRFIVYLACGMECVAICHYYKGGCSMFCAEVEQKIGRPIPKIYQILWEFVIPPLIVILLGMQVWGTVRSDYSPDIAITVQACMRADGVGACNNVSGCIWSTGGPPDVWDEPALVGGGGRRLELHANHDLRQVLEPEDNLEAPVHRALQGSEQECPDCVTPVIEETATEATGMAGHSTYRLSLNLAEHVHNVYAFAGLTDHALIIPPAYQCAVPFGSDIGGANPAFYPIANNAAVGFAEFDSWVTGGVADIPLGAMSSIGFQFSSWTATSGLDVEDGAWFYMDPNTAPGPETLESSMYLVAQISVPTGTIFSMTIGQVQGKSEGGDRDWDTLDVTWTNGAPADPCAGIVCESSSPCKVAGSCSRGVCGRESDAPDGTVCDDADATTTNDVCTAGVCVGVAVRPPPPPGTPTAPVCNRVSLSQIEQCYVASVTDQSRTNGEPFADCSCNLNLLTLILRDAVSGQSCVLPVRSTDQLEQPHTLPQDADGQPAIAYITDVVRNCVPADRCAGVTCLQATGVCKLAGVCTDGVCGAETNAPEGTPCDDGDVTTRDDTCSWGQCVGIDRCEGVTCDAPSSVCKVAGECVSTTGVCSEETNAVDGTGCDDGDSSTNSDMCTGGECIGTPPLPAPPPAPLPAPPPAPARDLHAAPACDGAIGIAVHIVTTNQYSADITWDIDGGAAYPNTPYGDNSEAFVDLCLPAGDHTIHYFDSFGDGWGPGAYWELLDESGATIAGGPTYGVVNDVGGETEFELSSDGEAIVSVEGTVTVTIVAGNMFTDEISWSIDDGDSIPDQPYADGSTNTVTLTLPEGRHTVYYIDSYGDGWGEGYWQIEDTPGGTVLAGGPTDGVVEGYGGEADFCVTCCDAPCEEGQTSTSVGASTMIMLEIQTGLHANEITFTIDSGPPFPANPYEDNTLTVEGPLALTEGIHTINYFDSRGNGWGDGAFWTVKSAEGEVIAGGSVDGVVTGAGGEDTFCVGNACDGYVDAAEMAVTISITSRTFSNEITWDIDGGTTFGIDPSFEENTVTEEVMELPVGEHVIHYFDSWGDGWHGGYWEITDCLGITIAGGQVAGQVSGTGGETIFTVDHNDECISTGAPAPSVDNCADVFCPQATGVCKLAGSCRQETGDCGAETNAPEGTPCDDGDVTTRDDTCSWGQCVGIDRCEGVTCDAPSSVCKVAGECVSTTGVCSEETNAVDGTGCDDGDSSTNSDMCTGGECIGTTSRPPPSPPPPMMQSTVEGQVYLDATMEDVLADRTAFELNFKEAMVQQFHSSGVEIAPGDVTVTDISGGSVVVSYSVAVTCPEPNCAMEHAANNAALADAAAGRFTVGEFSSVSPDASSPPPPPPITLPPPCPAPRSICGPGTTFDADLTRCVSSESPDLPSPPPADCDLTTICGRGTDIVGDRCTAAAQPCSAAEFCGRGTQLDGSSGKCVPSVGPTPLPPSPPAECDPTTICGPGTTVGVDGLCVAARSSPPPPPGFCTLDVAGVAEAAAERDVRTASSRPLQYVCLRSVQIDPDLFSCEIAEKLTTKLRRLDWYALPKHILERESNSVVTQCVQCVCVAA